jgi:hypothetical protein
VNLTPRIIFGYWFVAVETAPASLGSFREFEDNCQRGPIRQASLRAHRAVQHGGKRAFDDVGRAQMFPVLGREVVAGEQASRYLIKPSAALSYLMPQVSMKVSNATSASFLVSTIQISWSARLAFDC